MLTVASRCRKDNIRLFLQTEIEIYFMCGVLNSVAHIVHFYLNYNLSFCFRILQKTISLLNV